MGRISNTLGRITFTVDREFEVNRFGLVRGVHSLVRVHSLRSLAPSVPLAREALIQRQQWLVS